MGPISERHVLSVAAPGIPTITKREQRAIIALGFDVRYWTCGFRKKSCNPGSALP